MREEIIKARARIVELSTEINKWEKFIRAAKEVCDHDWQDADDLWDYHKRESHERCSICGSTR